MTNPNLVPKKIHEVVHRGGTTFERDRVIMVSSEKETSPLFFQHPDFERITSTLTKYGTPYLVGGSVRDALLGKAVKDFDIEVYDIPKERLGEIVEELGGKSEQVGKQFGVFKIGTDFDISLPRKEKKIGEKHTDFEVESDPYLDTETAAKRRDFSINSIYYDLEKKKILDHFGGIKDLKNGVIRHVNDKTFQEDSLRVYCAAQFAARFGFSIAPETVDLASTIDLSHLPSERIFEEFKKLLLRSKKPSIGLEALDDMDVLKRYWPEIFVLKTTKQRGDFHFEGSVYNHIRMVMDKSAEIIKKYDNEKDKLALMLASIAHDFGKPDATKEEDGKITQHGHEELGIDPTKKFLSRLTNNEEIVERVLFLVANHGIPTAFWRQKVPESAFKRLINKHGIDKLNLLADFSEADTTGRLHRKEDGEPEPASRNESSWFRDKLQEVKGKIGVMTSEGKIPPLVTGDDLISIGLPPSKMMGKVIKEIREKQEEGEFSTPDQALQYVKDNYSEYLSKSDLTKAYSRSKCMKCSMSPTVEFLWAEAMATAHFCTPHGNAFRKEKEADDDIVSERELKYGLASKKWSEGPPTKKEAEEYFGDDFEKARVAYHQHDGWQEHPVAVEHHQEYFSNLPKQDNPYNVDVHEAKGIEHGKPFQGIVWRGTGKHTPVDEGMWGKGTYFSSHKQIAEGYGDVQQHHLHLQKPYVPRTPGDIDELVSKDLANFKGSLTEKLEQKSKLIRQKLENQGYDGIILTNEPRKTQFGIQRGAEFVVFHPEKAIQEKEEIQKSDSNPNLIPKKVQIHQQGKTFWGIRWVSPEEAKEEAEESHIENKPEWEETLIFGKPITNYSPGQVWFSLGMERHDTNDWASYRKNKDIGEFWEKEDRQNAIDYVLFHQFGKETFEKLKAHIHRMEDFLMTKIELLPPMYSDFPDYDKMEDNFDIRMVIHQKMPNSKYTSSAQISIGDDGEVDFWDGDDLSSFEEAEENGKDIQESMFGQVKTIYEMLYGKPDYSKWKSNVGYFPSFISLHQGKEPKLIRVYRDMSAKEYEKWVSGEEIPKGKFFATDRSYAQGRDVDYPEDSQVYSFRIPKNLIVPDGSGGWQLDSAATFNPETRKIETKDKIEKANLPISAKALILDEEGRLLLLHNPTNSKFPYDLPGGHIDQKEDAKEALRRELQEEINCKVEDIEEFDISGETEIGKDEHPVLFYKVEISGEIKLNKEHSSYKWVSEEELDDLFLGDFEEVIRKFFDNELEKRETRGKIPKQIHEIVHPKDGPPFRRTRTIYVNPEEHKAIDTFIKWVESPNETERFLAASAAYERDLQPILEMLADDSSARIRELVAGKIRNIRILKKLTKDRDIFVKETVSKRIPNKEITLEILENIKEVSPKTFLDSVSRSNGNVFQEFYEKHSSDEDAQYLFVRKLIGKHMKNHNISNWSTGERGKIEIRSLIRDNILGEKFIDEFHRTWKLPEKLSDKFKEYIGQLTSNKGPSQTMVQIVDELYKGTPYEFIHETLKEGWAVSSTSMDAYTIKEAVSRIIQKQTYAHPRFTDKMEGQVKEMRFRLGGKEIDEYVRIHYDLTQRILAEAFPKKNEEDEFITLYRGTSLNEVKRKPKLVGYSGTHSYVPVLLNQDALSSWSHSYYKAKNFGNITLQIKTKREDIWSFYYAHSYNENEREFLVMAKESKPAKWVQMDD